MWKRALDRAGVREPRLRRDYTEQRRAVRRFATAEYAAARILLPAALLPHVVAAVAFMHDTDDRIDRGTPDERAAALTEWDGLVRKALAEGDSALPVLRCLARTSERHPDVRAHVDEFLRGCEREVAWRTIADDEELRQYVREYSLPALMLTACLLAPGDAAARAAFTEGCHLLIRAMQRIDFLEDLPEDVRAGRPGVPADAVARHGADLTRPGPALGRLVEEQAGRAAADLTAAAPLPTLVVPPYRPFVRALVGVQRLRLDAVRRAGASLATRASGPSAPAAALLLLREAAGRVRGQRRPARGGVREMMGVERRNTRSGASMAKRVHQPREDAEFDFILRMSDVPVLAYFTGSWPKAIEPCRAMDLVVGGIADEYAGRLTAVRTDITRCPAATERYGITGAPSYVLLKGGEVVAHGAGPWSTVEVREFLDGHL